MAFTNKPSSGRVNRRHALARGLVAAFAFGERHGSAIADATGQPGGSLVSAARIEGPSGAALSLGGSGYVALGSSDRFNLTSAFTVAFRFRHNTPTATRIVISRRQTAASYPYVLAISNGKLRLYVHDGSAESFVDLSPVLTAGVWYDVVVTRSGTQICAYLNGVLDATSPVTLTVGASAPATTTYIGAQDFGSGITHFITAEFDYLYLFNRALTAGEAAGLSADPFALLRPVTTRDTLLRAAHLRTPSVNLTQSSAAGFPDRPRGGGTGLVVHVNSGATGRYLEVDLATARTVVHSRVMISPQTVAGPWVTFLRGLGAGNRSSFEVRYLPASRQVVLTTPSGAAVTAALPAGLTWHCVEAVLDAAASEIRLYVNGIESGRQSTIDARPVRWLQLGGPLRHPAASGVLHLDEWAMADGYIGPVRVTPSTETADDPSRWLVIYNTQSAESVAWAEWYRGERGLPYANLLGLALPLTEQVNATDGEGMLTAIADYLQRHGLQQQVIGILCGLHTPATAPLAGPGHQVLSSVLQTMSMTPAVLTHPLHVSGEPSERLSASDVNGAGVRLVARLDAPDFEQAKLFTLRAKALETAPMSGEDGIHVECAASASPELQLQVDAVNAWLDSVGAQLTRMRLAQHIDSPGDAGEGLAMPHAFYWGWRASPEGVLTAVTGSRAVCVQLHGGEATLTTLRSADGGWAMAAHAAGYAAVAAARVEAAMNETPHAAAFFAALRHGWTAAEAWAMALPFTGGGYEFVGDPLMRLRFPQAGWNIYGPFEQVRYSDLGDPVLASRDEVTQVQLPAAMWPGEGQIAAFVVRHVGADGVEEKGAAVATGQHESAVPPACPPLLPRGPEWRPRRVGGGWAIDAAWPSAIGRLDIARVELWRETGEPAELVASDDNVHARAFHWHIPGDAATVRFQVRCSTSRGGTAATSWSSWCSEPPVATIELRLL